MKADGIESNYIYVDKYNTIFNDSDFWNNFAKQNNLITTIGSDFHNFDGFHPEIGFVNTNFKLSNPEVSLIIKNLDKLYY